MYSFDGSQQAYQAELKLINSRTEDNHKLLDNDERM